MIKAYVDFFIPQSVRKDADEYRRAFQITAFTQISLLFFIPNVIKWYKMGFSGLALSIFCVTVCVALISPFLLKFSQSLDIMGNFVIAALAWHFSVLPAVTGGILSSSLAWNIVIPVFVATFLGFGSFIFWSIFMLLEIVVFLILNMSGVTLPVLSLTPSQLVQAQIANVLGPFLTMVISLIFGNVGLKRALVAQKAAAEESRKVQIAQEALMEQSETLAQKLATIFGQVNRHTEHLTENVMEKMSSLTRDAVRKAETANDLIGKTSDVVTQTNSSMKALTTQMSDVTRTSEETSKIIKTIDEIAFQTNLLALNAAVEAARAGDAGAGFAVVADEVRNLAMRSAEAAKNTSDLIEDTINRIRAGASLVKQADENFTKVSDGVSQILELMDGIVKSSDEQSQGIADIKQISADIHDLVSEKAVE